MSAGLLPAALGGYVLGAIPFGLVLTSAAGLGDIRAIGSGNIGATNVLRTGRRGLALATLLLDGLKALIAVLLARAEFGAGAGLAAGMAAVVGHVYPVWLRFRGGKGVASAFGMLFGVAWPAALAAAAVWLAVARLTRISSAGALCAFAVAPALAWLAAGPVAGAGVAAISGLIFWRHRDNIRRLLASTEPRVGGQ